MIAIAIMRSLRPHQWTKNLILFAPLIFSRRLFDIDSTLICLAATAVFCATSGAVYLWNDVQDRERDREHPVKRMRPVASGELPVKAAATAAPALAAVAIGAALMLDVRFAALAAAYLINNIVYSTLLKHVVILDVGSIALGFVLRVLAGAAVIHVEASPWLIMCTILLACFLGFAKRRHEIVLLDGSDGDHRRVLADYSEYLLDQMIMITAASTVMSYALYTVSDKAIDSFGTTNLIYTVPFVLYGLFRYLYLVHKRNKGGSPSRLLLTDAALLIDVALWLAACCVIVYLN